MVYIFLDESGDLGFNPKKSNSKYFIITLLAVRDKKPIEKLVKEIHSKLRKKVKRISGGILHSYKEKPATRKRLLSNLNKKDCFLMTIYLNKSKVYTELQEEKHLLYNYVANILIDRIMTKKLIKSNSSVCLIAAKRETNKLLNSNFKDYLEKQIKNKHGLIIKINIKTPNEEKSLQAVDFVSWALFRKYEKGDSTYYNLIKSRIVEENPLFR